MHFFMNDVFAAPARALPSLPIALLSQDSCAKAEPIASVAITEARTMLLTIGVLLTIVGCEFDRRTIRRSSPSGYSKSGRPIAKQQTKQSQAYSHHLLKNE